MTARMRQRALAWGSRVLAAHAVLLFYVPADRVVPCRTERCRLSGPPLRRLDFAGRVAAFSEAAELALGADRAVHRHIGRIVVTRIGGEIGAPATSGGALTPALDAAKGYSVDLTPSVSAAAARSAIRASPPFIAWAAATPIIEVRVM